MTDPLIVDVAIVLVGLGMGYALATFVIQFIVATNAGKDREP